MRRFNISVNGNSYDVAVEEVGASVTSAPVAAPAPAPAAAPAAAPSAPATKPAAKPVAATAGTKVVSPMPGTIVNVNVAVGDTVKEGQVVMILDAMKMEKDNVAACDGTVGSVAVKKGDTVESNDLLMTIQ